MKYRWMTICLIVLLIGVTFFQGIKIASLVAPRAISLFKSDCQLPPNFEVDYIDFEPEQWLIEATKCDVQASVAQMESMGYNQWPKRITIGVFSEKEWIDRGRGYAGGLTTKVNDDLGLVELSRAAGWVTPSALMRRLVITHELTHLVQHLRSCGNFYNDPLSVAIAEGEAMMTGHSSSGTLSADEVWLDKLFNSMPVETEGVEIPQKDAEYGQLLGIRYGFYQVLNYYLLKQTPGGKEWGVQAFYRYDNALCTFSPEWAFYLAFKVEAKDALEQLLGMPIEK